MDSPLLASELHWQTEATLASLVVLSQNRKSPMYHDSTGLGLPQCVLTNYTDYCSMSHLTSCLRALATEEVWPNGHNFDC